MLLRPSRCVFFFLFYYRSLNLSAVVSLIVLVFLISLPAFSFLDVFCHPCHLAALPPPSLPLFLVACARPTVSSVNFDDDFMAELERRRAERAEQERQHAEELRRAYLQQKAVEEAAMSDEMQHLQKELEEKRRREEEEKVRTGC